MPLLKRGGQQAACHTLCHVLCNRVKVLLLHRIVTGYIIPLHSTIGEDGGFNRTLRASYLALGTTRVMQSCAQRPGLGSAIHFCVP